MEVTLNERLGRSFYAGAVIAAALARAALDVFRFGLLESMFSLLAGLATIGALAAWGTENQTDARARGADLIGLTLLGFALVARPFVDEGPMPVTLGIGFAGFVIGVTARSGLGAAVEGAAVAGGGALLLALGAAAAYVSGGWEGLPTALAVGGAGWLVMYTVLDRGAVGDAVQSRSFQYGSGAVVLTLLAGALGVGVYALSVRYDRTWDLTRAQSFTLSDHAAQVAGALAFDVQATAYYRTSAAGRVELGDLLEKFQARTGRIRLEWVDPLEHPRRAQDAQITGDQGTLVLTGNGRTRRLDGEITEDDMVRALVLLGSTEDHEVCWTVGHGEPDPDDEQQPEGLGVARLRLEGLNYQVRKVVVGNVGVPRSCDVVVIARPQKGFLPYEQEAVLAYLAEGGRVFALLDPTDQPPILFERAGVLVDSDAVRATDPNNRLFGDEEGSVLVLTPELFLPHPITRSLSAALVLPLARSVRATRAEGFDAAEVLQAGPDAVAEGAGDLPAPGQDVPLLVVVTVTDPAVMGIARDADVGRAVPKDFAPKAGGRLVVVGDSDFASNQFVDLGNNRDLFLNAIAWLADEDAQIGERPAPSEKLALSVVGEATWVLLAIFVIPGLAALGAVGTVVYRRTYL